MDAPPPRCTQVLELPLGLGLGGARLVLERRLLRGPPGRPKLYFRAFAGLRAGCSLVAAGSVPAVESAVFPLVVKRRSCLPQLDPLKHGRSFAVSWPYFLVLFVYRYIFSMDFFLIGRVHEVLYSYINLVSCLVLYMYSCTGTS